jgi:hypothetical protein
LMKHVPLVLKRRGIAKFNWLNSSGISRELWSRTLRCHCSPKFITIFIPLFMAIFFGPRSFLYFVLWPFNLGFFFFFFFFIIFILQIMLVLFNVLSL